MQEQDKAQTFGTCVCGGEGLSHKVLRAAFGGASTFAEFQERLDIPADALAVLLDTLVDVGFLEVSGRRRNQTREYVLVDRGECFRTVLSAFATSAAGEAA